MQSFRRAALRAACSSSRAMAVPRQQVASFAVLTSKQTLRPTTSLLLSRPFSQTPRAAEEISETPETTPASSTNTEDLKRGHTIFIGNMSYDATETHLHEAFGKYGEIISISIPRDGRGSARGFGFVNFAELSACEDAVSGADQSFWHGRRIMVQLRQQSDRAARPAQGRREATAPTPFLYIGNIPYETSDADLNALFKELEGLKDVRVAIDRNTGWPRGFAHADFESVEAATKAKEVITGRAMGSRQLRADFSARSKSNDSSDRSGRSERAETDRRTSF